VNLRQVSFQLTAKKSTTLLFFLPYIPTFLLSLSILLKKANFFDLSLDKDKCVVDMIVEVEGVKLVNWRWRRKLFQWEKKMADAF